jgi:hypothetical protein
MADGRASEAHPALPDFGPSLPQLVRRRFGVSEAVTTVAAIVGVLLVGGIALLRYSATRPEQITYRAGPTFNIQYSANVLQRVDPPEQELVRLEAHKGRLSASIAVSRLRLPPYAGNVTSGLMPVFADGYAKRLSANAAGFQLRDEGSARVNDAQGYQIGFRSGLPGHFVWGRDILLVPQDENVRDGAVLHLRYTTAGVLGKGGEHALNDVRKAFKSFNFGTDQGKW